MTNFLLLVLYFIATFIYFVPSVVAVSEQFTNPNFNSDNSSWSVAALPPSGWMEVPGDSNFSTTNFLAMKYEAKCDATGDGVGDTISDTGYNTWPDNTAACTSANNRSVVSSADGYPIANISHTNALTRCSTVSLNGNATHLMRNDEYMTIARNAEAQAENWSLGAVGSGYLFAGHNDNSPAKSRIASTTDTGNYACAYTDGDPGTENPAGDCPTHTASGESASTGNQKRVFTLSNGAYIWDIASNLWEHVQRSTDNVGDNISVMNPLPACSDNAASLGWCQYGNTTTPYVSSWTDSVIRNKVGPLNTSYNSTQGVGQVYTYKNGTSQNSTIFLRGGEWTNTNYSGAFAIWLEWITSYTWYTVGFRCASDPVAISQSWSSGSGRSGGGNAVTVGSITDAKIYQSVNVGNTSSYNLTAFAYTDGSPVTSSDAALYVSDSSISTTYTDVGSGWYRMSGTVTGVNESRDYGVQVKAGKTIYLDDLSLSLPTPSPTPTATPTATHTIVSPSLSVPSAPVCNDTKPKSAPWLYGAGAKSSDSILLQFTEAGEPVSEYVLEYGPESEKYQFAMANIGGKGTTSYEVAGLSPNTTYYFRVRAGNGCATGDWSNEISAKTFSRYSNITETKELETEIVDTEISKDEDRNIYTVKAGDSMYGIAIELFGDGGQYLKLIELNKDKYTSLATDPSAIQVGWELLVPTEKDLKEGEELRKEQGEVVGVDVKIKVVDEDKIPVKGAQVTLHSTPREAITNEEGVASFENVEPGEHKAVIAYEGYSGEQNVFVPEDQDGKEVDFTVQVKSTSPFKEPAVIAVIGVLIALLAVAVGLLLKRRKTKQL